MFTQRSHSFIIFPIIAVILFIFSTSIFSYAEIPSNGLTPQNSSSDILSVNDYSDSSVLNILEDYIDDFQDNVKYLYTSFTETDTEINKSLKEPEYPTERGIYVVREGMPRNTRHLKEGYWIGSLPDVNNIISMKEHGIKIILTVTNTKRSWNPVKRKIQELGIEHIVIPVGSRFPKDTSFYDTLLNYDPNEIFIHCDHGADRSGTFIAYMLARRNHWSIQKALVAMVNHNRADINGLKYVLKQHGYTITEEDLSLLSIYSGPYGGIKVRNEGYRRLVSTMLNTYHSTETKGE